MAQTSALAQHFQKHQQQILDAVDQAATRSRESARGSAEGKRVARTIARVRESFIDAARAGAEDLDAPSWKSGQGSPEQHFA